MKKAIIASLVLGLSTLAHAGNSAVDKAEDRFWSQLNSNGYRYEPILKKEYKKLSCNDIIELHRRIINVLINGSKDEQEMAQGISDYSENYFFNVKHCKE